ncbi:fish-egg lectin-like [Anomaloglossus baeobatrachus]
MVQNVSLITQGGTMIQILGLLLLCSGAAATADRLCIVIDGRLKQVNAGNGQVYGVNDDDDIYQWVDYSWKQIPGNLSHVTVGQVGVWGVDRDNNIYKLKDNNWVQVSGIVLNSSSTVWNMIDRQDIKAVIEVIMVSAAVQYPRVGKKIVVGVNRLDAIYCDDKDQTISNSANLAYSQIEGSLKYYTCNAYSCWGANANDDIYYRYDVKPTDCQGSRWQQVDGKLKMVEVGSDGSVYGVNSQGQVYKR